MTYVTLCLVFLAIAFAVAAVAVSRAVSRRRNRPGTSRASDEKWGPVTARALLSRWGPPALIALAAVVVLTAVFDSVLIWADVIRYDSHLISGAHIGLAPAEDFAYPLAVVVLVPSLWSLLQPRRQGRTSAAGAREGRR